MSLFLRLLEADDKAAALRETVQAARRSESDARVFDVDPEGFRQVPGAPFAYWVSPRIRRLFSSEFPVESSMRAVLGGLKTLSDERFLRASWEIAKSGGKNWVVLAKGGSLSRYYFENPLLIDWSDNGDEISWYGYQRRPREGFGATSRGLNAYFRPGLTWPRRTNGLSFRVMPAGCIFADKGPAAFVDGDDPNALLALCAVVNSAPFGALVALQLARTELAQSYEVGLIQQTPVPDLTDELANLNLELSTLHSEPRTLSSLAHRAWSLKRSLDAATETSHAFILPALLQVEGDHLAKRAAAWSLRVAETEAELAQIQAEIDDRCFVLYGIDGEERQRIESGGGASAGGVQGSGFRVQGAAQPSGTPDPEARAPKPEPEAPDPEPRTPDPEPGTPNPEPLLSWLIGVAFARFDPRLATGERPIPPEPEPFDPLPARSPGMIPEGEEPADRPDILVDDQGHADDLAARVRAVAERVKVEAPEGLRAWLAKDFFPLHIRMYSKSRRKAPIYWQLATFSASYSVWLYIHAFTKDTLFRVQNDYVAPKLAHEERRLEALTAEQRDGATATERKALAEQQALVEELRDFLAEVKRVAPLWSPNLDDGVIINFSLLWRLVPQHKPWQKELKKTWHALCEGKYDWAHLAVHLWPERVVPKCAEDRSLAIAHDLENVFWEEDDDGKWRGRVQGAGFRVQEVIDGVVRDRTSVAVKDALKGLLEAPAPAASRGRTAGRRSPRRMGSRVQDAESRVQQTVSGTPNPDPGTLAAIKQVIEATGDAASKADVLAGTGLSDAQWTAAINVLLVDGSVTKIGAGRGTRYRLTTDNRH